MGVGWGCCQCSVVALVMSQRDCVSGNNDSLDGLKSVFWEIWPVTEQGMST